MSRKQKKIGIRGVLFLCLGLFVAGYLAGTFFPLPVFEDASFFGAMRRPGSNTHRR